MVAAFGVGAGRAALDRAIAYSKERIQFGKPLADFQGYTHKLVVPHAARIEAASAYVYATADRIDGGEQDLQIEGSIAKYFATECGNAAAEAAIQALGGYGYIREYEVEKIKRDVKIVCIYEGTSEIQQNIIGLFRMKENFRTKGRYYAEMAARLEALPEETAGPRMAAMCSLVGETARFVHEHRLIRQQHAHFTLADMFTWAEVGDALCHRAASEGTPYLEACARVFSREAARKVIDGAHVIAFGTQAGSDPSLAERLNGIDAAALHRGEFADLDALRDAIYE
jgi:alkylation response protein AidB-like acyl-CoA dehydrogenase